MFDSQRSLAQVSGLSRSTVSRTLRGGNASARTFRKISRAVGLGDDFRSIPELPSAAISAVVRFRRPHPPKSAA